MNPEPGPVTKTIATLLFAAIVLLAAVATLILFPVTLWHWFFTKAAMASGLDAAEINGWRKRQK